MCAWRIMQAMSGKPDKPEKLFKLEGDEKKRKTGSAKYEEWEEKRIRVKQLKEMEKAFLASQAAKKK